MNRLRTIRLVAGFDLYESLRSRKAIAVIALYTLAAIGASALFISFLNHVMLELSERFGEVATADLLASDRMVEAVAKLVGGNEELAREVLNIPPLALFYGWLASLCMPLVVVLTSSDTISDAVSTGKARFALFRAERLDWTLGKLAGQTLLMVVGIACGGVSAFLLGAVMLDSFEAAPSLWWIAVMSGRACFYGFAYLGVAMCASQLATTNAAARALGIFLLLALWFAGTMIQAPFIANEHPEVVNVVKHVFPNAYSTSLFHPTWTQRLPSMAALVAIGAAFFGMGYWRFSRRDT